MLSEFQVDDLEQWRGFCPQLHVEGGLPTAAYEFDGIEELLSDLRIEGYVHVPDVLPTSVVEPLRDCVQLLHRSGIPLPFAFVYDEFWLVYQRVSHFISAALGGDYRALPDFWAWYVPPTDQGAGWGPHRDRVQPTLEPDNSPHSLTVWLPFTDATPLNGCMYVLPAHHDERFTTRVFDGPGNNHVPDPHAIRALPATAGSFLAWNQALLHWGSRASRLGTAPRMSAAFEFQRADQPAYNQPLLDPHRMPSFTERLGLIGKQVLQYRHMYPLSPDVEAIAVDLRDRFMPEVFANAAPSQPFGQFPAATSVGYSS
jgi:hypothetical protein